MIKRVLAFLIGAALFAAVGAILAVVIFPDRDEIPGNSISTDAAIVVDVSTLPTSAAWVRSAVAPGNLFQASIAMTNNNNTDNAAVSMTLSNDDGFLAAAVRVVVAKASGACDNGGYLNADGTSGSVGDDFLLFDGVMSGLEAPVFMGNIPGSGSEVYCFAFNLPLGVDFDPIAGLTNNTVVIFDTTS